MGAMKAIESGLLLWVRAIARRPWLALSVVILLSVGGLTAASQTLRINTDASEMIDARLPYRQAMIAFDTAFPELSQTVLVLVRAPTPDEADAFTEALSEHLRGQDDFIKSVYAPTAHPFFAQNGLLYLDEDRLDTQLDRISKAAPMIEAMNRDPSLESLFGSVSRSASLLNETDLFDGALDPIYRELALVIENRLDGTPAPLAWQRLFADTGTIPEYEQRLITISPVLDYSRLQPAKASVAAIEAAVTMLRNEPGWERIEVGITGNWVLRGEELRSVSNGMGVSFIISITAVAILLWLAFRSKGMALVSLGTLIATLAITAGFASLAIGALNLVSIAFTVLLIGLGIDFAIHFALHVVDTQRHGNPPPLSLQITVHEVGPALALAAMTTTIAFFAFIPTKFVGMAQLGIISGAGVTIAFLVAITVIPAAATLLPPPAPRAMRPIMSGLSRVSDGPAGRLLALFVTVLSIVAILLLPKVRFDADPMSLRNLNSPSVVAFNKLFDNPDTVPYRLSVLTDTAEAAQRTGDRLRSLPEVGRTLSVLDFIPEDQDIKLELISFASGNLAFALRPQSQTVEPAPLGPNLTQLIADLDGADRRSPAGRLRQALLDFDAGRAEDLSLETGLTQDMFRFWPFQVDRLRAQLNPGYVAYEDLPEQITSRFINDDGVARVEIVPHSDINPREAASRRRFVEEVTAITPNATGSALNVLRAGEVVSLSMLQASLLAGVAVLLMLWLLVRDLLTVGLILLPVILAGIFTSATGVLLNLPYNFANVIVIPLLVGLGADNGIHLALRSRQMARHSAVFATTTPRAVLFSALTTIASFGSLALSEHRGTASMGALLTISLGFTLFCTLVVLPAAMDVLDRRLGRTRPPPTKP